MIIKKIFKLIDIALWIEGTIHVLHRFYYTVFSTLKQKLKKGFFNLFII